MIAHLLLTAVLALTTTAAALPSSPGGSSLVAARDHGSCCFAKNCLSWSLDGDGRTVRSTCYDKKDQRHWDEVQSALNLAECVTNHYGTLIPYSNGGFDHSCHDCSISGTIFSCQCKSPTTSTPVTSKVDLNSFIADNEGRLSCFDYTASVISRREMAYTVTGMEQFDGW